MESSEFVAARGLLGLTQSGMASTLGVDQATISRWESGKARIPSAIALALATLKEKAEAMASPAHRVLVADSIAEDGIAVLQQHANVDVRTGLPEDELVSIIPGYSALVVRSQTQVTRPIIEAASNLLVIGRAGVGVDNIDTDAATERGIVVVNAPLGNTVAAAEHTIALLMALARHIPAGDASLRAGEWRRNDFIGTEIRGKTLGVVGLGKIGSEVARRAIGLEMRILAHDPFVPEERARALGVEQVSFADLIANSDFITVHPPLTAATKGMIGAEELAAMKDGVRLINVARGGIIDEAELAKAVDSGKVAGAAIDVFTTEPPKDSPLVGHPRIIATPHLGASTAEAQERVAIDVADQIVDVLAGRAARYAVNAPILAPETMQVVQPYMGVAELLGSVAMQLVTGNLSGIEVDIYGEIADHDISPIRASVIRGLLRPISEESVNLVNANVVAQARGWDIEERLRSSHEVFHNLIELRVATTDAEISVAGTILSNSPHLVMINGLDVDISPAGIEFLLVCDNEDRPGMIGTLGTILGEADINISSMQVGRRSRRGHALMLLGLDECPTEEQIEAIEGVDGIQNVRVVHV